MSDQGDSKQAKPCANQQRDSDAGDVVQREQRKKGGRAGCAEVQAKTQCGEGHRLHPRSEQAEENAAGGHRGHHGFQVRTCYAEVVSRLRNANCAKIRK